MYPTLSIFIVFTLLVGVASFVYHEIISKVCLSEMEFEFERTYNGIVAKARAQGVEATQSDVAFVLQGCRSAQALAPHFSIWILLLLMWRVVQKRRPHVELLSEKAPCFLSGSTREITNNLVRCGFINSPMIWCFYKIMKLLHNSWNMMRTISVEGSETAEYVISAEQDSESHCPSLSGTLCFH